MIGNLVENVLMCIKEVTQYEHCYILQAYLELTDP